MPIYEYKCGKCEHEFEALQKMSDEPLKTCPSCDQDALIKKVSAAAFRLKGGGWYETDFKSGNKKNLAAADKPPGSAESKSGKSDSKSASSRTESKTSASSK